MKRQMVKLAVVAFCALMMVSCFKKQNDVITVVSREEGSGTRSAFTELFGVLDGNKKDAVTLNAEITNNTAVMISSVVNDKLAIGYISMGSLNSDVKVLKIDDAQATAENVVKGVYPISRPFIVATKGEVSEVAQDFINFIMSANGQKVVESNGYVAVENNGVFVSADVSGKIVVAGSSSVSPLMEKLKEAYTAINQNASIEIQQNDSSTGIKAVENDICDIGMSSRELKPAELEKGLNPIYIARDGLAVIVNKESNIDGLTKEQVKSVYLGDVTKWSELK